MKAITLHPVSVLVGAALVGLSLVLTGAAQGPWAAQPVPRTVHVVDEIPAEWWTYVPLAPGQPAFTVPIDKRLVVTAIEPNQGDILANGLSCLTQIRPARINSDESHGTRVVFDPGTTLAAPNTPGQLWGYLEPVR